MQKEDFKSISFSRTTLTELMIPAYANFGGKVHGGIILSLMDKVAYACAAKHSGMYCVTASVDAVDFLAPVEVGDMISMTGEVIYVGRTSMMVKIRVIAEDFDTNSVKHTNTSYFTMVAKSKDGGTAEVPGLILEDKEELIKYIAARNRRNVRFAYKKELVSKNEEIKISDYLAELENERCQFNF